jgi:hypothetical protein
MTVAQFIPEARPETAKSGSLVVEVEPLLRLGGAPVARIEDKRFDPLVELLIELDIGVILFPQFSNFRPCKPFTAKARTAHPRRPRILPH